MIKDSKSIQILNELSAAQIEMVRIDGIKKYFWAELEKEWTKLLYTRIALAISITTNIVSLFIYFN